MYKKHNLGKLIFLIENKGMGKDILTGKSVLTPDKVEFKVKVVTG